MALASNPMRKARRIAEFRDRLGCENPVCIVCGYSVPAGLRRVPRTLLEKHHVFGQRHDLGATVIVCLRCHAELTEAQADAGVQLQRQDNPIKRVAAMLRSLAALVNVLGPALLRMAADLEKEEEEE